MRRYNKFILGAVFICLMILLQSCSSSVLVDVWRDPSFNGASLQKIFIIAIRRDPTQRRIWEDAFVSELSKKGVKATSSYQLFPKDLPDTNEVIQTIQEKGFDGILITRLLDKETETHYVESYVTSELVSRYNVFRKRYDTYFRNVRHPGYVESQTIDRRAIDVWAIRGDERMIWSATSNSPERNSMEAVQNDIADLVIPELSRNAIIKK